MYSIAPRIPPGWGQRIIAKSVALAVAFIVVVALLGCWVEKLWCSAVAGLHRFRDVGFKIVGDVCCRLAPEARFKAGASAIFNDFWEIPGDNFRCFPGPLGDHFGTKFEAEN